MNPKILIYYTGIPEEIEAFVSNNQDVSFHKEGVRVYDGVNIPRMVVNFVGNGRQNSINIPNFIDLLKKLKLENKIIDFRKPN